MRSPHGAGAGPKSRAGPHRGNGITGKRAPPDLVGCKLLPGSVEEEGMTHHALDPQDGTGLLLPVGGIATEWVRPSASGWNELRACP